MVTIMTRREEESQAVKMQWLALPVEERKKKWDELEATVPHNYDPYPVKRAKLAKAIKEIDELMERRVWRFWTAWNNWDFVRNPITYCFTCLHPVKLVPEINPNTGKLKMLKCEQCSLIHYDARYD